jgi:hypothetical protein
LQDLLDRKAIGERARARNALEAAEQVRASEREVRGKKEEAESALAAAKARLDKLESECKELDSVVPEEGVADLRSHVEKFRAALIQSARRYQAFAKATRKAEKKVPRGGEGYSRSASLDGLRQRAGVAGRVAEVLAGAAEEVREMVVEAALHRRDLWKLLDAAARVGEAAVAGAGALRAAEERAAAEVETSEEVLQAAREALEEAREREEKSRHFMCAVRTLWLRAAQDAGLAVTKDELVALLNGEQDGRGKEGRSAGGGVPKSEEVSADASSLNGSAQGAKAETGEKSPRSALLAALGGMASMSLEGKETAQAALCGTASATPKPNDADETVSMNIAPEQNVRSAKRGVAERGGVEGVGAARSTLVERNTHGVLVSIATVGDARIAVSMEVPAEASVLSACEGSNASKDGGSFNNKGSAVGKENSAELTQNALERNVPGAADKASVEAEESERDVAEAFLENRNVAAVRPALETVAEKNGAAADAPLERKAAETSGQDVNASTEKEKVPSEGTEPAADAEKNVEKARALWEGQLRPGAKAVPGSRRLPRPGDEEVWEAIAVAAAVAAEVKHAKRVVESTVTALRGDFVAAAGVWQTVKMRLDRAEENLELAVAKAESAEKEARECEPV